MLVLISVLLLSGFFHYSVAVTLVKKSTTNFFTEKFPAEKDTVIIENLKLNTVYLRTLVGTTLLAALLAAILILTYSNRVAGPIYHLRKHLELMIEGNYDKELHFREKDEFKYLADAINKLQEKLKTGNKND